MKKDRNVMEALKHELMKELGIETTALKTMDTYMYAMNQRGTE